MRWFAAVLAAMSLLAVAPVAGATQFAAGALASDQDSADPGWGWADRTDDGAEIGVSDPGEEDSSSASNASYVYQPPPECSAKAVEDLRTAVDDKELEKAVGNLAPGCVAALGVWDAGQQCFVSLLTPPFPKGDPAWEGNDDGVLLECLTPTVCSDQYVEDHGTVCANGPLYWAPAAPPGIVDPGALAREAVSRMTIEPIDPGFEPSKGPGAVGVPTWYWVEDPSEQEFGSLEASASAGGYTVTAQANVEAVHWDLNGEKILTCGKGTPYDPSMGMASSPDCGHVFETQGVKNVTARSHWVIEWDSGDLGYSGTIELDREAHATFTIGEVQVLNR